MIRTGYAIENPLDGKTGTRLASMVGAPVSNNTTCLSTIVAVIAAFTAPHSDTKESFSLSIQ